MAVTHFGFGAQSAFVTVPAVMVVPVTLPPTATPPQFASTLAGGVAGFEAGTK
jgi:hypothetical protein